jgi:hypothetical protein
VSAKPLDRQRAKNLAKTELSDLPAAGRKNQPAFIFADFADGRGSGRGIRVHPRDSRENKISRDCIRKTQRSRSQRRSIRLAAKMRKERLALRRETSARL